jgi:hypothetical protein
MGTRTTKTTLLTELTDNQRVKARKNTPKRYLRTVTFYDQGEYFWGTWVPVDIPEHPTDILHVVGVDEIGRADNISYMYYKTPHLYWVILRINDIVDPFEEMYGGMILRIPQIQRVLTRGVYLR